MVVKRNAQPKTEPAKRLRHFQKGPEAAAAEAEAKEPKEEGTTEAQDAAEAPQPVAKTPQETEEAVALTPEVLSKLQHAEDSELEAFWNKCSTRQQQCLWKKFEKQRKEEGTEAAYRDAVRGSGMRKKSAGLMKVWLKHQSTKHPVMVQQLTELRSVESFTTKETWVPLETIKQKYGPAELKARVAGGSVLVRKSPSDPRFPEFQDLSEERVQKTEKTKLKQGKLDAKATWDDFKQLADMEVTGQIELDFIGSDASASEAEEGLDAKALALTYMDPKDKSAKQALKVEQEKKALESFETASAMADESSAKSTPELKKEIKGSLKVLKEIDSNTPAGVAKRAPNDAAATGKRALKALGC
ncbi:Uncharacterized protein SCF082_LOCUS26012 [Durusdinium trenchii]|uniref:Uncharacterized protein n=1 Tax=Durusdinium trenchii TaxID=1381693 RepID=A0ABP0M3W4_9DINO